MNRACLSEQNGFFICGEKGLYSDSKPYLTLQLGTSSPHAFKDSHPQGTWILKYRHRSGSAAMIDVYPVLYIEYEATYSHPISAATPTAQHSRCPFSPSFVWSGCTLLHWDQLFDPPACQHACKALTRHGRYFLGVAPPHHVVSCPFSFLGILR